MNDAAALLARLPDDSVARLPMDARDAQLSANALRETASKLRAKAALWGEGITGTRILARAEQAELTADALEALHFRT